MQVWTLLTFSIYCCSVDTAGPKVWPLCFVETRRSPEQSPVVGCFSDGMVQESWKTAGDSAKKRSDGWWKKSGQAVDRMLIGKLSHLFTVLCTS